MRRLVPFAAVVALVVVLSGSADAGVVVQSQLAVTPNPATTAQPITIGNAPGDANTCEKGEVFYSVVKVGAEGEGAVAAGTIVPDENGEGDWSVTIDPIPVPGHFTVSADCTSDETGTTLLQPDAVADFDYADVDLVVTEAVVPSSSTSEAPAASTRPTFTG
jgi:hypothetical protein